MSVQRGLRVAAAGVSRAALQHLMGPRDPAGPGGHAAAGRHRSVASRVLCPGSVCDCCQSGKRNWNQRECEWVVTVSLTINTRGIGNVNALK